MLSRRNWRKNCALPGMTLITVREHNLQHATDETIFDFATIENRILVSADTDFGAIVTFRQQRKPSVILFRNPAPHHPDNQAELLLNNLPGIAEHLESGAIVILHQDRIRVRRLS